MIRHARAAEMTVLVPVEVGEMEASEAVELFQKYAKLQSPRPYLDTEVPQIVEELGKLALAITLAGSYVAATPRLKSDIRLYLAEYRERRKQLLGMKARKLIHRYGESVLSTWETSFASVERQSPIAARLLSVLAFLNFDDIFLALFEQAPIMKKLSGDTSEAINRGWQSYLSSDGPVNQYTIEAAFGILQTYSLIQWRDERGGYSMHKLVHTWGQERLDAQQQQELSLMALKLLTHAIPHTKSNPVFRIRLVPHVMANFIIISAKTAEPTIIYDEIFNSLSIVGGFLHDMGRWLDEYEVRAFHFKKICEWAGNEHPDTLNSMSKLANVLQRQGKYEQAEEMHRQVLELRETVLGKEHPNTLSSMNNLARVLNNQGKYELAEEMHRQTLKLRETMLGKTHPNTLESANNLAIVLENQGKYEQAEEMHRQILKLREVMLGKEHPDTLWSMNNLAAALGEQGKFGQAEELYRRTIKLRETVLGQEHPETLGIMNNLAVVMKNQGKYELAEEMHRRTLKLKETMLGKDHPKTLESMNNLAVTLGEQGKFGQAEELYRRTIKLRETVLGQEHPKTLASVRNLKLLLRDQRKHKQTEDPMVSRVPTL